MRWIAFQFGAFSGDDQRAPDGGDDADDQERLGYQLVRLQRQGDGIDDFHGHHNQQHTVQDFDGFVAQRAIYERLHHVDDIAREQQYG
ncbi:MAG: hypothetical protein ABI690_27895 [Chloroflexota bacterium]